MSNNRTLQEDITALENAFTSPVVNKALEVFNAVIEGVDDNYGTAIVGDRGTVGETGTIAGGDNQVSAACEGDARSNAEGASAVDRIGQSQHYRFGKRIAADSGY